MNKKYYDCFSIGLMKFLRSHGVEPIKTRVHHSNENTIWVFIRNDELDRLLTQWTKRGKVHVLQAV